MYHQNWSHPQKPAVSEIPKFFEASEGCLQKLGEKSQNGLDGQMDGFLTLCLPKQMAEGDCHVEAFTTLRKPPPSVFCLRLRSVNTALALHPIKDCIHHVQIEVKFIRKKTTRTLLATTHMCLLNMTVTTWKGPNFPHNFPLFPYTPHVYQLAPENESSQKERLVYRVYHQIFRGKLAVKLRGRYPSIVEFLANLEIRI